MRLLCSFQVCDQLTIDTRGNYAALVSEDGLMRLYDLTVLRKNTVSYQELQRCGATLFVGGLDFSFGLEGKTVHGEYSVR